MLMQKLMYMAQVGASVVLYVLLALSVLSSGSSSSAGGSSVSGASRGRRCRTATRKRCARASSTGHAAALHKSVSLEAAAVAEALEWRTGGATAVQEILQKGVRERRKKFEGGLLFLGTLGNNAPFIGLFGTVLGIVTAFRELGQQPGGRDGQRDERHRRGADRDSGRHPGRAAGGHLLQRLPEEGLRHRGERGGPGQRRHRGDARHRSAKSVVADGAERNGRVVEVEA